MLWLQDLVRQTDQRLDLPGANFDALWSPSGDSLIFTSMRKGHFDAYRLPLSEGVPRPIIEEPYDQQPLAAVHDGKRIVLYDYLSDGTTTITVADVERPSPRTRLSLNASTVDSLRLSPDDKWFAATVTSSGRSEIVVSAFPGPGALFQITSRGGRAPTWSRTGSTLYYQRDDEIVAATYSTASGRFTIAREETLFRLPDHNLIGLTPEGRFLMTKKLPGQATQLQVVLNWLKKLRE